MRVKYSVPDVHWIEAADSDRVLSIPSQDSGLREEKNNEKKKYESERGGRERCKAADEASGV